LQEFSLTVERVESKEYIIHSVPSNLPIDNTTFQPKSRRIWERQLTILEDHPVLLYTRVLQTGTHDVVVGCLIAFGGDPFHVLKEAGKRRGVNRVLDKMRDC
jgi:hypothetical protein